MDEEEKIKQLIQVARLHPKGSSCWRRAMDRLIITLKKYPEFSKYQRSTTGKEALNNTWEWLSQNLTKFEPRTSSTRESLVRWINGNLNGQFKHLSSQQKKQVYPAKNVIVFNNYFESETTAGKLLKTSSNLYVPGGIELLIEQQQRKENQRILQELAFYIKEDKDMRLRNCYPLSYPECNCQLLSQRLFFMFKEPPDRLVGIAKEFKINYKTLYFHWNERGLPLLREILILDLGYKRH